MKYRTIVADPPWEYDGGFPFKPNNYQGGAVERRALPYPSLTVEDILALPIRDLAPEGGAVLFLWATNRYLPDAYDVCRSWGFTYRQTLVWRKTNAQPLAGSVAPNAEFLIVGRRGPFTWSGPRWPCAVIDAARSEHSRKPEVFADMIESIAPPPYLELFARRQRLGWDTWGNEALEHVQMGEGSDAA